MGVEIDCSSPGGHLRQAGTIEGLSFGNTIVARKNITLGPSQIRYQKKEGQAAAGESDKVVCSYS